MRHKYIHSKTPIIPPTSPKLSPQEQLEEAHYTIQRLERQIGLYKQLKELQQKKDGGLNVPRSERANPTIHDCSRHQLSDYQKLEQENLELNNQLQNKSKIICNLQSYCSKLESCLKNSKKELSVYEQFLFKKSEEGAPTKKSKGAVTFCPDFKLLDKMIVLVGSKWDHLSMYKEYARRTGAKLLCLGTTIGQTSQGFTNLVQNENVDGVLCSADGVKIETFKTLKQICDRHNTNILLLKDSTLHEFAKGLEALAQW